ncbi:MAG: hypothetical protein MAG551_01069 [Candidatus Scalindua arabica]|uniref:Transmembrane protein n=1 Tax=Candidatus Scalindua arabica TaxID=1127984 RepID=A0A942A1V0_9BACT|nr:hypothetical protein [Candidatus Scalindua arabica]
MLTVSTRTLNILAAVFWCMGGIVLLVKGGSLLVEAYTLKSGMYWIWIAITAGPCIGSLKGKFIFSKIFRRNLARIRSLDQPKVWQIFRPWFFLFLAAMIATGVTLSRMAHGNYYFLIGVTILDFSIAIALLWSSSIFWKQKAFAK